MTSRLTIFAKGNADVRDALLVQSISGAVLWNGLNQVMRDEGRDCVIRVRHETSTCFAALRAAGGAIPAGLAAKSSLFGPFPLQSQFSDAVFVAGCSAVVLSIQGEITVPMVRHRREGFLLHVYNWPEWTRNEQEWLRDNFEPLPLASVEQSMMDLTAVIERLRARSKAPILVFNVSATSPGETIHCFQGVDEIFSQRARRFNAALADASARIGFSIVDVDRLVATHGARHVKIDALHLNPLGCRLVAEEVVRIFEDYGLMPEQAT